MPRAHVIAFCLIVIGAYGVLYAMHAGRVAAGQIYDLETQVSNLEDEVENIKSTVSDLEYRRY